MTDYAAQDALAEMLELADELDALAEGWARASNNDDVSRARAATLGMSAHKIRQRVRNIKRAEGLA